MPDRPAVRRRKRAVEAHDASRRVHADRFMDAPMPAQFLLSLIEDPSATGCLLPSSKYLAGAMARAAVGADFVVELGAGTGPVTHALLRTLPEVPLIAVEIQPRLAHQLQQRFPAVDVRQDTAKAVVDALHDAPERSVVVSSLPFRSLPAAVARETAHSICEFLRASRARKLIQFTYQPRIPFSVPAGFKWRLNTIVWRNAPPAGVWELAAV